MKQSTLSILDICYIGVFAAVIAVMAQIMVPMAGGVPVTMQTLAVALAGVVLGKKRGALACVVYLLLGAVGLPVFAGFSGGLGVLFRMTGGFLVSFPLLAYCAGLGRAWAAKRGANGLSSIVKLGAGLAIGALLNYAVGTIWFSAVSGNSIAVGIAACVAPFVINDIIKLAVAGWLGMLLRKTMKKSGLLKD